MSNLGRLLLPTSTGVGRCLRNNSGGLSFLRRWLITVLLLAILKECLLLTFEIHEFFFTPLAHATLLQDLPPFLRRHRLWSFVGRFASLVSVEIIKGLDEGLCCALGLEFLD